MTQTAEDFSKPGAGAQLRPVRVVNSGRVVERGPRHQAHGLNKGQTVFPRRAFNGFEAFEQSFQFLVIDFNPTTADQLQALDTFEQRLDFGCTQTFTVKGEFHFKIKQGIHAEGGGWTRTDNALYLWVCRPPGPPVSRCTYQNTGCLQLLEIF